MRGRCCQCLLSEKLKKKIVFFYLFGISYILPTCYVSSVPLFPDTFPFFLHPVGLPLRLRLALSECHFELEKLRIVLISIWKMSTKPKRKPNKKTRIKRSWRHIDLCHFVRRGWRASEPRRKVTRIPFSPSLLLPPLLFTSKNSRKLK